MADKNSGEPSSAKSQRKLGKKVTLSTWLFTDPDTLELGVRNRVITRRRLLSGGLLAFVFSVGGNLLGFTSLLLSFVPSSVIDALKPDQLYPVRGFKRCVDNSLHFEFRYPKDWLEDQAVYLFKQSMRAQQLDFDMSDKRRNARKEWQVPSSAFGPPGSDGSTNVSVVSTQVLPGFSMQTTLGTPEYAAHYLLDTRIAPQGSGKSAELIEAYERPDDGAYVMEFIVRGITARGSNFEAHNVSVIAYDPERRMVHTLTVLTKESLWSEQERALREVASSFRLL